LPLDALDASQELAARREELACDARGDGDLDLGDAVDIEHGGELAERVGGDGVGALHEASPAAGWAVDEVDGLVAAAHALAGHLEDAEG
jgi:hypothetical protein